MIAPMDGLSVAIRSYMAANLLPNDFVGETTVETATVYSLMIQSIVANWAIIYNNYQ